MLSSEPQFAAGVRILLGPSATPLLSEATLVSMNASHTVLQLPPGTLSAVSISIDLLGTARCTGPRRAAGLAVANPPSRRRALCAEPRRRVDSRTPGYHARLWLHGQRGADTGLSHRGRPGERCAAVAPVGRVRPS
jgi:hypothetical protein